MALSGLDIYKLLPKTNCRKCNFPTCLAFALALAKKSTDISKCPFLSAEAKVILESSAQPPVKLVTIGVGEGATVVGNETVMFRHEEKFYHPSAIGLILEDTLTPGHLADVLKLANSLKFERVGQKLRLELVAVKDVSGSSKTFASCVKSVVSNCDLNIVLMSDNPQTIEAGLEVCKDKRPLVFAAKEENFASVCEIAKAARVPLVVSSQGLDALSELSKKVREAQVEDLVLHINEKKLSAQIESLTQIRRLALKKNFRPLGYPSIVVVDSVDPVTDSLVAGAFLAKYASIILMTQASIASVLSLLTLGQNIYSDPQKPLQVEPKIYPVGSPTKGSPLLVTTNFSLSYYTVLAEVEASKIASYILSVDTEGMSVLTAWAAEKFTPEKITQALKSSQAEELLTHKKVVIPGYVAVMSADLEEKSGWTVCVGPREASGITSFLKNLS